MDAEGGTTIFVYARVLPSTEQSDFLSIDQGLSTLNLTVAAGPNERGLVFVPPTLRFFFSNP